MKGLLQSKIFRKNVGKWLFMYVGVMLLLATVITYSRYISSLQGSDKASTARFHLNVSCTSSNGKDCDSDTDPYPATEDLILAYTFTVDASEIDVKSKLKLMTFIDPSFELISINDNSISYQKCVDSSTTKCPDSSILYFLDTIDLPNELTESTTFEINVKYKGDINSLSKDPTNPTKFGEVVTIGYAVEQVSSI